MKKIKTLTKTIIGTLISISLLSCETNLKEQVTKIETYSISPDVQTAGIAITQYSVDSICSLNVSDDIADFYANKVCINNGQVYILDTDLTKKMYIFDYLGNLKSIIGERGYARREFIGKPNDFFVDSKGRLHVFDKLGHKILVFDKDGEFDNVNETSNFYPHSFGVTSSDKYMMYFPEGHINPENSEESPASLILLEEDCKNYLKLIASNTDLHFFVSSQTFFQDKERLSYIPPFSDSVYVFKEDMLEKVVAFDFGGKCLIKEHPEYLTQEDDYSFMSGYQGVLGLRRFQETESLMYMEYLIQNRASYWLYNKKSDYTISGLKLFEGINPYSYFCFEGEQIIAYVDRNIVKGFQRMYDNSIFQENLKKSPECIKDMIEGKIQVPALVYISLK